MANRKRGGDNLESSEPKKAKHEDKDDQDHKEDQDNDDKKEDTKEISEQEESNEDQDQDQDLDDDDTSEGDEDKNFHPSDHPQFEQLDAKWRDIINQYYSIFRDSSWRGFLLALFNIVYLKYPDVACQSEFGDKWSLVCRNLRSHYYHLYDLFQFLDEFQHVLDPQDLKCLCDMYLKVNQMPFLEALVKFVPQVCGQVVCMSGWVNFENHGNQKAFVFDPVFRLESCTKNLSVNIVDFKSSQDLFEWIQVNVKAQEQQMYGELWVGAILTLKTDVSQPSFSFALGPHISYESNTIGCVVHTYREYDFHELDSLGWLFARVMLQRQRSTQLFLCASKFPKQELHSSVERMATHPLYDQHLVGLIFQYV